ncbi:MAG: EAL domain-containing protein [Chloroflexota bacterium]|nr:MAG: EAL domain-containing protein [Chloroflexota bacterium]
MIPPEEFIRLAEETGLIIHLDRLVLDEACRQMSEWHQQFPTDPLLTISVNISGKQFVQGDLIGFIQETLKTTGLDARCLKLEITESAIMENIEHTNDIFARLKQLGIQIEIDDFGIGYSSLSYLSHFPISAVKIDRSFVNLMSKDGSQLKIVQAIVMLAHGLGIEVIAEGVETENQLLQIRALGCEQAQGYIVSMPADSHSVRELLVAAQSGEKLYPPMFS